LQRIPEILVERGMVAVPHEDRVEIYELLEVQLDAKIFIATSFPDQLRLEKYLTANVKFDDTIFRNRKIVTLPVVPRERGIISTGGTIGFLFVGADRMKEKDWAIKLVTDFKEDLLFLKTSTFTASFTEKIEEVIERVIDDGHKQVLRGLSSKLLASLEYRDPVPPKNTKIKNHLEFFTNVIIPSYLQYIAMVYGGLYTKPQFMQIVSNMIRLVADTKPTTASYEQKQQIYLSSDIGLAVPSYIISADFMLLVAQAGNTYDKHKTGLRTWLFDKSVYLYGDVGQSGADPKMTKMFQSIMTGSTYRPYIEKARQLGISLWVDGVSSALKHESNKETTFYPFGMPNEFNPVLEAMYCCAKIEVGLRDINYFFANFILSFMMKVSNIHEFIYGIQAIYFMAARDKGKSVAVLAKAKKFPNHDEAAIFLLEAIRKTLGSTGKGVIYNIRALVIGAGAYRIVDPTYTNTEETSRISLSMLNWLQEHITGDSIIPETAISLPALNASKKEFLLS
ncbi:MAG: hypothetical protein ACMG6E_10625, partial [Candidatus Roizmanbacteria bacterium]